MRGLPRLSCPGPRFEGEAREASKALNRVASKAADAEKRAVSAAEALEEEKKVRGGLTPGVGPGRHAVVRGAGSA
jgi:hypothetical protein